MLRTSAPPAGSCASAPRPSPSTRQRSLLKRTTLLMCVRGRAGLSGWGQSQPEPPQGPELVLPDRDLPPGSSRPPCHPPLLPLQPIPAGPSPATTSWPKCKGPYAICRCVAGRHVLATGCQQLRRERCTQLRPGAPRLHLLRFRAMCSPSTHPLKLRFTPHPPSFANCTLEYPGKAGSHIGGGLAACGCSTPGPGNNLTDYSLVDPAYM